LRAPATGGVF